jgi:hypothetical protein
MRKRPGFTGRGSGSFPVLVFQNHPEALGAANSGGFALFRRRPTGATGAFRYRRRFIAFSCSSFKTPKYADQIHTSSSVISALSLAKV